MSIHGAVSSRAFDLIIEVKSVSAVGRGARLVLGFSSGDGDSASVGILRAMVSFDHTRGSEVLFFIACVCGDLGLDDSTLAFMRVEIIFWAEH